ncbi:MAG: alpha/beta fold hydrolase [Mycobacterium sp.]
MNAPFVFLHPLGADRRFWDPVRAELGAHPTFSFDLPGHGSAPALEHGTGIGPYSAVVAARLDELGTPVHLVGMSLGGLVAQQLAATRPDLIASAFLVDTVPIYPEPLQQMWRERAATARADGVASLVDPMVAMWFSAELADAGDQRVIQACNTFRATDPEGYARSCDLLAEVDLRDQVSVTRVPITVVCGEHDAPAFLAGAEWLASATSAGPVQWLPGRHACAVEVPAAFAAVLLAAVPA